jgi:hypothetical protein
MLKENELIGVIGSLLQQNRNVLEMNGLREIVQILRQCCYRIVVCALRVY